MPRKSKKYKVTTRTDEVIVLRRSRPRANFGTCPVCQRIAEFLPLDSAAARLQLGELEVIRLLHEKAIHAFETEDGQLLVCGGER
ncbi:MAG: hypothetical protein IPK58_20155 [Acidobacteria bacterium]|nr:hypothetical protein [Acidobacteriota bacterium]